MRPFKLGPEILSVAQHAEADRIASAAGISFAQLMESAGRAVAAEICVRWTPCPVVVLCGPGNNGRDGLVVARVLEEADWPVRTVKFSDLTPAALNNAALVVDALFGAGLSRPLEGQAAATVRALTEQAIPTVAVDVPSGVFGDSGAVEGPSVRAQLTVTFFRKKPAHLLYPSRKFCGEVVVADIATPEEALVQLAVDAWENGPALWALPRPELEGHKYARGHVLVVSGGPSSTGAARLAAEGALRAGAGVVTVACPPASLVVNASHLTEVLIERFAEASDLSRLLLERKRNVAVLGPGNGVTDQTRDNVLVALSTGTRCVLDADALTAFADQRSKLFEALRPGCVLTPHDGEFVRLFPQFADLPGRLLRARAAAKEAGVVVVLKGPDTVIAHPDGRAIVNSNAPPILATAGSGDVLAGFVAGLLAQGMNAFSAACAAVWLHGEAAARFGAGLIASDLHRALPLVLGTVPAGRAVPLPTPRPAVEVRTVAAVFVAVISETATLAELPKKIPVLLSKVYEALEAAAVPHLGMNIVMYRHDIEQKYLVEAGVRVTAAYTGGGSVRASQTPKGRVAAATHWGGPVGLAEAHRQVREWCKTRGHALTGVNWEVYGHWSDDPGERRTDIYYQLA